MLVPPEPAVFEESIVDTLKTSLIGRRPEGSIHDSIQTGLLGSLIERTIITKNHDVIIEAFRSAAIDVLHYRDIARVIEHIESERCRPAPAMR